MRSIACYRFLQETLSRKIDAKWKTILPPSLWRKGKNETSGVELITAIYGGCCLGKALKLTGKTAITP